MRRFDAAVAGLDASYDVVVVGAGPAGSTAAGRIAGQGHRVLLLEDDPVVGQPMQCAGLVTRKLFEHVPLRPEDVRINGIHGAVVYAPGGRQIEIDAGGEHALVMDRSGFDAQLASAAQARGAVLWTNARYVSHRRRGDGLQVELERKLSDGVVDAVSISARLVIGADGVQSNVGRVAGLPRPREFLGGFEAEMDGLRMPDRRIIPVFTDQRVAPGFFSWIIPLDENSGRGGLCMQMRRTSARRKFDEFLQHQQVRPYAPAPTIRKPIVGTVPLGMPKRFVSDRVMLVGDACAMPKPTSGGGIWTGIVAATIAAEEADAALRAGDLSAQRLQRYGRRFWRSKVGREIRIGWRIRRAFAGMSNRELDEGFRLLANRRTVGVIDSFGDIDHPSHLLAPMLMAEPRLLKLMPRALARAFAS